MTAGRSLWPIGGCFGLLLAGCSIYPPHHFMPAAPLTCSFAHEQQAKAPLASCWWEAFGSKQLDELVSSAFLGNHDLKQLYARLKAAQAAVGVAGSLLWPQLGWQASATRYWTKASEVVVETGGINQLDEATVVGSGGATGAGATGVAPSAFSQYLLQFPLSYEIDLWGRIRNQVAAAQHRAASDFWAYNEGACLVAASVVDSWFTLAEHKALLELLAEQIKTNKTLVDLLEVRFSVGEAFAVDVYQQRLQLLQTQTEVPPVRSRYETTLHQLYLLLGMAPHLIDPPISSLQLVDLPPFPDLATPFELMQRRPDLKAAYQRLLAADREVAAALADRLPQFSLAALWQFAGNSLSQLFQQQLASLGLNIMAPLLDGGRRQAEVMRRCALTEEALEAFTQALLIAIREVEDAIVQEEQLKKLIEEVRQELKVAESTLEAAQLQYAHGLSDYLPVIAALQSVQRLQRQQISQKKDLLINRSRLYRALGCFFAEKSFNP